MSSKAPLPLRLVQSEWARKVRTKSGTAPSHSAPSSLLAFYKPSGTPMYPSEAAQHAERRLFSPSAPLLLPSKFTSDIAAATGSVSGAASSSAAADSCFTRLLASLPPGAHPTLALPMLSPLHYRLDNSLKCNNEHTCFGQKGVSLVVRSVAYQTPREASDLQDLPQSPPFGIANQAMFLRQCQRFGFVRSTYHVLVRLPGCVASRMLAAEVERRSVRVSDLMRKQQGKQMSAAVMSSKGHSTQLTNPYLREHVEEKRKKKFYGNGGQARGVEGSYGEISATAALERFFVDCVPYEQADGRSSLFPFLPPWWTADPATESRMVSLGSYSQQLRDCRVAYGSALPPCARCDPLLRGNFYDSETGLLKLRGKVAGVLARGGGESERQEVAKAHRLSNLFLPFHQSPKAGKSATDTASATHCSSCMGGQGKADHPWMPASSRVFSTASELWSSSQRSKRGASRSRLVEQPFEFDFRLVQVGDTGDFALYEVTTSNATEAELRYAFASASLYVLNDYEYDIALAKYVSQVNDAIKATPKAHLSSLPLRLQQRTIDAAPVESVVEPLFRLGSPVREESTEEGATDASTSSPSSKHGGDTFHVQLLCHALAQCTRENAPLPAELGRFLQYVLLLQCGSGIELRKLAYPSVTSQSNSFVMQQVLQLHEQHHGALSADVVHDFMEQLQFETKSVEDGEGGESVTDQRASACDTFTRLLNASSATDVAASEHVQVFASLSTSARALLNLLSPASPSETTLNADGSVEQTLAVIVRCLTGDEISESGRIPSFTRMEERCQLRCGFCGEVGHVCRDCPSGVPLLQADQPIKSRDEGSRVAPTRQPNPTENVQRTSDASMSLDDVKDMLTVPRDADGSAALDRSVADTDEAGESIIPVPSALPTRSFDPHALMRARAKPSLHRRARCSYCGSQGHHITQCPLIVSRLDSKSTSGATLVHFTPPRSSDSGASDRSVTNDSVIAISTRDAADVQQKLSRRGQSQSGSSSSQRRLVVDQELMKSQSERLFCIKCGSTGHLYYTCPRVPRNLHIALHCPICMQPKKSIVHDPENCPRRAQLPNESRVSAQSGAAESGGYLPNGIPKDFLKVEERKERTSRRPHEHTPARESTNGTRRARDGKWAESTARGSRAGKTKNLFRPVP